MSATEAADLDSSALIDTYWICYVPLPEPTHCSTEKYYAIGNKKGGPPVWVAAFDVGYPLLDPLNASVFDDTLPCEALDESRNLGPCHVVQSACHLFAVGFVINV